MQLQKNLSPLTVKLIASRLRQKLLSHDCGPHYMRLVRLIDDETLVENWQIHQQQKLERAQRLGRT